MSEIELWVGFCTGALDFAGAFLRTTRFLAGLGLAAAVAPSSKPAKTW
jgi:hypothetical protein